MGFELYVPQSATTGKHSLPFLTVTKKGMVRLTRGAATVMGLNGGATQRVR